MVTVTVTVLLTLMARVTVSQLQTDSSYKSRNYQENLGQKKKL